MTDIDAGRPTSRTKTSERPRGGLRGKTAIITGARRSIGRAIATALADAGAKIVVHYMSGRDDAKATVAELDANGVEAFSFGGDLSDSAVVRGLFDEAATQFGGIDIVVANAGVTAVPTPLAEISDEVFESMLNTNTRGTFYVLREAARTVRDGGRIINISSSSIRAMPPGYTAYAASKSAALTTIGILAQELGGRGITANSVMAGPIGSGFLDPNGEMLTSLPPQMVEGFMQTIQAATPAGRIGQPSDIAPIAAFLASLEAGWINGQTILANNGGAT